VPPLCSRNLPFPPVTDPAAPPIRPQRHVPNSIATMHHLLIVAGRHPSLRLMSTPNHRRHFGALGATASGIKVSSGGRNAADGRGVPAGAAPRAFAVEGATGDVGARWRASCVGGTVARPGQPGDLNAPVNAFVLADRCRRARRNPIGVGAIAKRLSMVFQEH
jgi:hypothetical protein